MTKPHHLTPQSAQHFMDAAGLGESRFNPWVALRAVLLLALFILFGLVGVTFGEDSFLSGAALNAVRVCGLGLCGVALVVQPRRFRLGVSAMILGLVCLAVVGSGMAPLAFVLVLVETWAISTHARSHRGLWLGSIFLGSFAALTWWFVAVPLLLWEQPHWELWGWRMVILNAVFTVLLVVLSILVVWLWGRVELRKVQTMEVLAARAELAAVEERNRIAREMHDIVAHSLSGIIAQADGGRYAASQDPAAAIAALQTISKSGREALAQMRDVLSVLHDSDALGRTAADGDGVKPGVEQIPALINDATLAGLQIRFEETGAARPRWRSIGAYDVSRGSRVHHQCVKACGPGGNVGADRLARHYGAYFCG